MGYTDKPYRNRSRRRRQTARFRIGMSTPHHIRLGSRGSALALWQTEHVAALLRALYPDLSVETVVIQTRGDRFKDRPLPSIGGKGLFTEELEERLRQGRIDGAVHSLKDLPVVDPEGLALGAIPARGEVGDALVIRSEKEQASETGGAMGGPDFLLYTKALRLEQAADGGQRNCWRGAQTCGSWKSGGTWTRASAKRSILPDSMTLWF